MRIAMIGQKRFGSREGGIEVVVTELAKRMAALGNEVTCYDRGGRDVMTGAKYPKERFEDGVHSVSVKTVDFKGLAALTSSIAATIKAMWMRPDVIHYHAEGPCVPLFIPHLARIRTVATIHGLDWKGTKWGKAARSYIKLGERIAARYADEVIVLSRATQNYFRDEYHRKTRYIPNGVDEKERTAANKITAQWDLTENSYVLFLGRLVPDKGIEYLIDAYKLIDTDTKLVISGGGSDTAAFEREIKLRAKGDNRIVFTGFVEGELYEELLSNAYAFVLPSDREGMPMSLLEAMAYGRCCITSDIAECADVIGDTGITFRAGCVNDLVCALETVLRDSDLAHDLGKAARRRATTNFNWDRVVADTIALYAE